MKEDRERFMANGMNDYVPKPIRAEVLVRKVAEWIDRQVAVSSEQLAVNSNPSSGELLLVNTKQPITNNHEPITNNPNNERQILSLENFQILDHEIIKQLADSVGGDMSFVTSILEGFEEESTEQIQNAIEGYKANNCKQVQGELHTLKGNSGTLGAMRLHEITRIIEEKAKYCDFQLFENEIVILQEEFEKFKKEVLKISNKV